MSDWTSLRRGHVRTAWAHQEAAQAPDTCREAGPAEVVTVCKRKRPSGWRRWRAYTVGADSYGTWVYTPARSTYWSDDGTGRIGRCEVAQDLNLRGRHSLVLLPATGWFVAHWVLNAEHLVSVDISTPPTQSGSEWPFDDLELDPFVLRDGTFGVEDEDEFVTACRAGMITDQERDLACATVDLLRQELTPTTSPLNETACRRLADALQLDYPALVTVPTTALSAE